MNPVGPLPQNWEAERAVLGAILLDNAVLAFLANRISPLDFFHDLHRKAFYAMLKLAEQRTPIDFVTLIDAMQARGDLHDAEDIAYVTSLTDGMPRVSNVEHYVRIVQEKSMFRHLAHAGEALMGAAINTNVEEVRRILASARELLVDSIRDSCADRKLVTAEEFLKRSTS